MSTFAVNPTSKVRVCTLKGHPDVPLSWQVQDSIRVHGLR